MIPKIIRVGTAALLFRLLFLIWGSTDWYLLEPTSLSVVYFYQGYGIRAGYGYIRSLTFTWEPLEYLVSLVNQGQYISPQTVPPVDSSAFIPEMLHPPGMALLVAAIHWITGSRADIYVGALGMLLDTAAACILYWMVAKFFSARVAFASGLIYALYPPLAYACTLDRSPEGLMSIFIVASLACVLQSSRNPDNKGVLWWAVAGLLVGTSAYFRPDYLLVPVAFGCALWLYTRRFWRSMFAMMTMQAIAFALLTPWAYRNHQLCGRWIFTSTSTGWTLVNGLGQYNNPWGIIGLDQYRYTDAQAQGISSPASSEADLYFRKVFWESVKSKPLGYVASVAKRLPMAIVGPQTFGFNNPLKTIRFSEELDKGRDRFAVVLSKPLYVLKAYWEWLLMGLMGFASFLSSLFMVICERRRFGLVFLLLSPHLYSIGAHLLTHYEPRFVLPSTFSLLIGLAYVLSRGWRDRQTSSVRHSVVSCNG